MSLAQKIQLVVAISFLTIAAYLAVDVQNTKHKQLQVGVKYRPEVCERKTAPGDTVHVHYKGMFKDGTEFDNSYKRGQPIDFTLGEGRVIQGWERGLLNMCVGEKRLLKIPPSMGYGEAGAPPNIPGNAGLLFEAELVKIE